MPFYVSSSERRHGVAFLFVATQSAMFATAAAAQRLASPRVVLRDDAAEDPEFARFKARILAAAEAGDTVTLMASMVPDISSGYEASTPEAVLAMYHVTPGRPWLALRLVSSENSRFEFRRIDGQLKLVALARGAG